MTASSADFFRFRKSLWARRAWKEKIDIEVWVCNTFFFLKEYALLRGKKWWALWLRWCVCFFVVDTTFMIEVLTNTFRYHLYKLHLRLISKGISISKQVDAIKMVPETFRVEEQWILWVLGQMVWNCSTHPTISRCQQGWFWKWQGFAGRKIDYAAYFVIWMRCCFKSLFATSIHQLYSCGVLSEIKGIPCGKLPTYCG